MIRFTRCASLAIGLLVALCSAGDSLAEDCCVTVSIPNSASFDQQLGKTRPGSFMSAMPGGTFVITVALLSPSPEEAIVDGRPVKCSAVPFRVDTLRLSAADGMVEVELGDRQVLEPGETRRIMYSVDRGTTNLPAYELDQMGFVFRSGLTTSRCSIFANGLFYPDASSTPVPIALIPSVHSELNAGARNGQGNTR